MAFSRCLEPARLTGTSSSHSNDQEVIVLLSSLDEENCTAHQFEEDHTVTEKRQIGKKPHFKYRRKSQAKYNPPKALARQCENHEAILVANVSFLQKKPFATQVKSRFVNFNEEDSNK